MLRYLRLLGQWALDWIASLGRATLVWFWSIAGLPQRGDFTLLVKQIYQIGVLSLIIIILSAFSIGAVLALQGYTQLARVGAEESVGLGVALVLLRELGPVVTGLLFAGRAGSAITAEIGLMKATDQLSSMEMMGVDPLHRIAAPRLWAGMISMPLLTVIFNAVAIWGAALVGVEGLGVGHGTERNRLPSTVTSRPHHSSAAMSAAKPASSLRATTRRLSAVVATTVV